MESYRIGWKKKDTWHYIVVHSREDMLMEVADKTLLSDRVSVKKMEKVRL